MSASVLQRIAAAALAALALGGWPTEVSAQDVAPSEPPLEAPGAGGAPPEDGTPETDASPPSAPEETEGAATQPPATEETEGPATEDDASSAAPTGEEPAPPPEPPAEGAEPTEASAGAEATHEHTEASDYSLDSYDFDPDEICPFCEITPAWPEGRRGLHWHSHWSPVGTLEYVVTPALFATVLAVDLLTDGPTEARWDSPILFDDFVRDSMQVASRKAQDRTSLASDILLYGSIAYPTVIDNILITWIGRQSPRVAWQMFVINAQAYAMNLAVTGATKRIAARQRPWGEECPEGEGHDCNSENRYLSFFSGHASMTATSAGLTCAHHTQLSLYKNPVMDSAACVMAVVFTSATGVFRMSSDNHWATDVLAGHFMGYVSGYLYPTLMYYRDFQFSPDEHHHDRPRPVEPSGPVWAVLPVIQSDVVMLSAGGIF